MAIDKKTFEQYKHGLVHAFLSRNNDQAFTVKEIANELKIASLVVNFKLASLKKEGLVKNHNQYWTIEDRTPRERFILDK